MHQSLLEVSSHFSFEGELKQVDPITIGHINNTYLAIVDVPGGKKRKYVLQQINQFVFKDPQGLMRNIQLVTQHLRGKVLARGGDPERETLNLVKTTSADQYFIDGRGEYWRAYQFVEDARTYESINNPRHVYETAWAIGNFQCQMADFPAGQLCETIPKFHYTPKRYEQFQQAVQEDRAGRVRSVREEIQFLERRSQQVSVITNLIDLGRLPLRVTHNDAKLNNVMIDDQTGKAICILDLDTVMPGSVLYDFGDVVRSTAALVPEDHPDDRQAGIALDVFEGLVHGYLDAAREFLTPVEIDYLAFSGCLITLEQALRFLADYLNGDIYYKIDREQQNLDRARTQIKMVQDMETKFDKMQAIITKYR
jgi:hypothetical protein